MSLFSKEMCCICNTNKGNKKIADGYICNNCLDKGKGFISTIDLKKLNKEYIVKAIETKTIMGRYLNEFKTTKQYENYLVIDEINNLWKAPGTYPNRIFSFDEIIDFELLQNGKTITKGGLRGAIIGGAVFGEAGAVVGSIVGQKNIPMITEFCIKINLNNPVYSKVFIYFVTTSPIKQDSILFKHYNDIADNIIKELSMMSNSNKINNSQDNLIKSEFDEIMKFKKLLDEGIITQEEFAAKKKQILDI